MRYISNEDVINNITIEDAVRVTEQAFLDYYQGKSQMPNKVYLDLPEFSGDFRAMPAYSERYQLAGVKWVNSHKNNPSIGLPSVMATMIVNRPDTAEMIGVFDASGITALRTGAAGAVAVKYCTPNTPQSIAFIGAGEQAWHQFLAIHTVRELTHVAIFDLSSEKAEQFKERILTKTKRNIEIASSVADAVQNATIIVTATPSKIPILNKDYLRSDAHINAIGADAVGKQECHMNIHQSAQLIVDDIEQAAHSGEIHSSIASGGLLKTDVVTTLGACVSGDVTVNFQKLSLFDSTGLAIQDLALAGFYLQKIGK